jgi:hypothetical protein
MCESCWFQWKYLTKNSVPKRHWKSPFGRTKTADILLQNKMEEMLAGFRGRPLGRHLGVNKTLEIRRRYCWLYSRNDIKRLCQ